MEAQQEQVWTLNSQVCHLQPLLRFRHGRASTVRPRGQLPASSHRRLYPLWRPRDGNLLVSESCDGQDCYAEPFSCQTPGAISMS